METGSFKFDGFFKETVDFFKKLKSNNNKKWFDENQGSYAEHVLSPAKNFIVSMGEKLEEISPAINADPRINKSLFRINRDTRFGSDKTPYKTNLGIVFWDGDMPRMESSVFYFFLDSSIISLGAGIYKFTASQLDSYRKAVASPFSNRQLSGIINDLTVKGYEFGGKKYKKTPKGYDGGIENAELFLYDGLYVDKSFGIPEEFFTGKFIDFCFKEYREMLPFQKWLSELIKKS